MFFKDIKTILEQYVKGESSFEDVNTIVHSLKVERYLPLIRKYAIVNRLNEAITAMAMDVNKSSSAQISGYYITYDINLAFTILESYAGIISSAEERISDNYDLILKTGFYYLVIETCKTDVEDFKKIADRVIGVDNLWIMSELEGAFCQTTNVENMEKIVDLINNGIDNNTLDKMQSIRLLSDPNIGKFVDNLKKESAKEVMKKD